MYFLGLAEHIRTLLVTLELQDSHTKGLLFQTESCSLWDTLAAKAKGSCHTALSYINMVLIVTDKAHAHHTLVFLFIFN